MLKGIIISFVLSLLWISVQIASFHIHRPHRIFLSLLSFFMISVPLFPMVYLLTSPNLFFLPQDCAQTPQWLGLTTGLLAHTLFFFAYVEFFYYVERAVTLRMLVEMSKKPRSTLDDIQKVYNVERMLAERLGAMKENGFVERVNELWHLTPKGKLFAKTFILSRRILNLRPGQ